VIIHFELIVHIKAIARVFMLGQLKEKEKANGLGALIIESSHILVTKKREKKKRKKKVGVKIKYLYTI